MVNPINNRAAIIESLGELLDECDRTIGNLCFAYDQEVANGAQGFSSLLANNGATHSVNALAGRVAAVNALLTQNPEMELLDQNIDGKRILEAENKEWSLAAHIVPAYASFASFHTAGTISEVTRRVRDVEARAQIMYNQLNPDTPRTTPCCRDLWACFTPITQCLAIAAAVLLSPSAKRKNF